MIRRILLALTSVPLLVIGVTYAALEADSVITVITNSEDNQPRTTRIWFAAEDGQLYLEAGNPANPWVQDLSRTDSLHLTGSDIDGHYTFKLRSAESDHLKIREMMRRKYGWRDWWISVLFDTTGSQLVEIHRIRQPQHPGISIE